MELAALRKIDVRDKVVHVVDRKPGSNKILNEAICLIAQSLSPKKFDRWISKLSGEVDFSEWTYYYINRIKDQFNEVILKAISAK